MALLLELVVVEVGKISCDVKRQSVRWLMFIDSFYYIGYYGGGGGGSIYGATYGGGGEYGIYDSLLTHRYVALMSTHIIDFKLYDTSDMVMSSHLMTIY